MPTVSDRFRPAPAGRPGRLSGLSALSGLSSVSGLARTALVATALIMAPAAPALAATLFACEPEWAALSRELLPDAKIHVATQARQDPHHIEARPALIAQLRSADMAVCTGASLEAGWLPMLQERAGNAKVQPDAPGMFFAASTVELIDRQEATLNPFAGDVHAEGNPHVHADPQRLLLVARRLADRMQLVFPDQASAIGERYARFETRWTQRMDRWIDEAQSLRGQRVATQHGTFAYLWRWLGVEAVADLEPRPGLSPTPGHLQSLLKTLRPEPPFAIVIAQYHDPRAGRWVSDQLGGKVPLLTLASSPVDPTTPEALDRWFDELLAALLGALKSQA